jgi:beta-N-acetylhexosaminidase
MRAPAATVALLLLGCAGGCGGGSEPRVPSAPPSPSTPRPASPRPEGPVDRLSLGEQVGQVLVLAFGGTTAPEYVRRALREGRVSGVILFGGNVSSPGQVRALTASLQQASGRRALVMTDQEGGPFHILPWAAPSEPQSAQATPAQATAQARAAARDVRAVGINVTLAPVADVGRPGSALGARTFPGGPREVGRNVADAVRAYRAGGIAATAKHFPGLGGASENTDDAAVSLRLDASDLVPFKEAIAAGVPLVMASHAVYENVDGRRLASQSPVILTDLLRRRLGYEGVVITDSMEAEAVTSRSTVAAASERALMAGADLVLMTGDGSFRPVSLAFLARARRDRAFRARVRAAAARVLELKRRLRLSPPDRH